MNLKDNKTKILLILLSVLISIAKIIGYILALFIIISIICGISIAVSSFRIIEFIENILIYGLLPIFVILIIGAMSNDTYHDLIKHINKKNKEKEEENGKRNS